MIGVIIPSRGLMFSQTADEILQNLQGVEHKFFFAHGLPIPSCFENPTLKALADKDITHLWYIEDDMILKVSTLKRMLELDAAVVCADYPVNKKGRGAVFKVDKKVVYCGTGCLLVKREVFNELRPPYFRTDMRWNIKNYGDFLKMRVNRDETEGYGLHDVNFCMNLWHLNIPIHQLRGNLGQRKLVELGKAGTNDGAHQIEQWETVVKDQLLNEIRSWPVEKSGNLVTLNTPTGEINVSPAHAKTLLSKGLATKPPRNKLVVDWGAE